VSCFHGSCAGALHFTFFSTVQYCSHTGQHRRKAQEMAMSTVACVALLQVVDVHSGG